MTAPIDNPSATADREIVQQRVFEAPREMVFDAFTRLEHIGHWWGPNGFTTTTDEMDVRPGGVWRFTMHGPDGTDYPNKIVYHEVVRPERLAYAHGDGDGPAWFEVTVTFEEQDGKTTLTMRSVFPSAEIRDALVKKANAIEGGRQTLARLAAYLQTMPANR